MYEYILINLLSAFCIIHKLISEVNQIFIYFHESYQNLDFQRILNTKTMH